MPRRIPDEKYTEVFAGLRSHRDRALPAFWVATGARAGELLAVTQGGAVVGEQTVSLLAAHGDVPDARRAEVGVVADGPTGSAAEPFP